MLTCEELMGYWSSLALPATMPKEQRIRRAERVLAAVGLTSHVRTVVSGRRMMDSGEWETDALFDNIYKFCDVDGSLLSTVCGPATLNRIKCKRDKMVT